MENAITKWRRLSRAISELHEGDKVVIFPNQWRDSPAEPFIHEISRVTKEMVFVNGHKFWRNRNGQVVGYDSDYTRIIKYVEGWEAIKEAHDQREKLEKDVIDILGKCDSPHLEIAKEIMRRGADLLVAVSPEAIIEMIRSLPMPATDAPIDPLPAEDIPGNPSQNADKVEE